MACGSSARDAGSGGTSGAGSGDTGTGEMGSLLTATDSNSSSLDGDGWRMCEMWSGLDNALVPGSNPSPDPQP